ncbi:MFS transporter, ACS family, glucarate transporter [Formivibrio citricus]|uniref:MFS transporter, ACS family, glucarate transporter n=1 Tax=Formivibrio citricus TaxID=83765 RepID=A0A1I4WKJ8_9NEIS|nr:MFS transporter [Formivibrio citricus]SFN14301.1 MFS transporter, ACS family, glucarate transporter [Formivibrio citricus]
MSTAQSAVADITAKKTNVRWTIVLVLFLITVINYADRATIALAGPVMSKELGFSPVEMGYIFSAFGWSYVICQLPGGWLLDRFGSKRVYAYSIFFWSLFTLVTGGVSWFAGTVAFVLTFALRFLVGAAEAPSFPANSRIVAAWFPANERGTASAIFNSAQYAATVFFAPLMGWLIHNYGWHSVFAVMGVLGILFVFAWHKFIHDPKDHPNINQAEIDYIEQGGGLVNMDQGKKGGAKTDGPDLKYIKQLLSNRMMVGIYIAQYCINALTYFFITWFPVYLVKEKGMSILKAGFVAAIPAVCGFVGGVLGGVISDFMLKKGFSLSTARKTPIVLGMLMSMSMVVCNYVTMEWAVIFFMSLAFFGKGIGALGWAVNSDAAPKQIAGLSGGLMNTCGNLSSITTPIAIGYILQATGSFNGALVYVGVHAFIAIVSYLFIVGEIKRVELK